MRAAVCGQLGFNPPPLDGMGRPRAVPVVHEVAVGLEEHDADAGARPAIRVCDGTAGVQRVRVDG
eukprot:2510488-Heterocapsa_arctica.AAC.1